MDEIRQGRREASERFVGDKRLKQLSSMHKNKKKKGEETRREKKRNKGYATK